MIRRRPLFWGMVLGVSFFVVLTFRPLTVEAAASVVINEIYSYSSSSASCTDDEWIELYNTSTAPVDVSGWKLADNSSSERTLGTLILPVNGFALISKDIAVWQCWQLDPLAPPADIVFYALGTAIGNGLANSNDHLILKNSLDTTIDQIGWGGSDTTTPNLGTPHLGKSFERKVAGIDTDTAADFFENSLPTPGQAYVRPTYSDSVRISEILPHPEDGTANEFIELYNSGAIEVDLTGWQLDDDDGGSTPYLIPTGTAIAPGTYLAFYSSKSHISLNDSGDSARLFDPNGDLKSSTSYLRAVSGQTYILTDNQWQWSTTITPTATNILTQPVNNTTVADGIGGASETLNITETRSAPVDQIVTVTGTVTAPPGALSAQTFYIQDGASGIQVYSYRKDFPVMQSGDQITVTGTTSEIAGESRIKIDEQSDVEITGHNDPPAPVEVKVSDIDESYEGRYIKTHGVVSETSGDTFVITDSSSIKVMIRESTGIEKPAMRKGDNVQICGIISQHKDEYRILPFRQEDVTIIERGTSKSALPSSGSEELVPLCITVIILGIWNLLAIVKQKHLS